MKKTFTILGILVVAALVATLWERVDDAFLRKTHPQKYAESVEKYAAEYDVPESVVYAVIKTESGFTPDAVSLKGAIGLMQITPDTHPNGYVLIAKNDKSSEVVIANFREIRGHYKANNNNNKNE